MFPVIFSLLRNGFSTSDITSYHGNTKQQKSFTFTTEGINGKVTNGPESSFPLFYRYLYTPFSIFRRINYATSQRFR